MSNVDYSQSDRSANGYQQSKNDSATHRHFVLQGLGGSGKAVWYEVEKDLPELLRAASIRNVLLDSDAAQTAGLTASRCYLLTDVPAYDLVEQMRTAPDTLPGCELLGDPGILWNALGPSDDLSRGAPYGERKLGLMALWFHVIRAWPQLAAFLVDSVRNLKRFTGEQVVNRNGQGPVQQRLELNLSQMYSACGGTGSAIGIYVADMMHYLLRQQWGLRKVLLEADILLPTVFLNHVDDPTVVQAKAYAFFLELGKRYQNPLPPVMVGTLRLDRHRPPYEYQYYYDGVNTQGRIFTSIKQVVQVVSLFWQLRSFGRMSEVYRGLLVHMPSEYPNIGAAPGAYMLEIPVKDLILQFAYRTGMAVLRHKWLKSLPDLSELSEQAMEDFLNQHPDVRNLPAFKHDLTGEPLEANTKPFDALPRQKMPPALDRYEREKLNVWKKVLEKLLDRAVKITIQAINLQLVNPQLNRKGGLLLTWQILTDLVTFFERHHQGLTEQIERQRERYSQKEQQRQERRRHWWGRLEFPPRSKYRQYRQERLNDQFRLLQLAVQLRYVQQVTQHTESLIKAIESWLTALASFEQRLETGEQDFVRQQEANRSVVIESILNEADTEQLYDAGRETALKQAADDLELTIESGAGIVLRYSNLADGGNGTVVSDHRTILSQEGMKRHLAYTRQFWSHLDDLSIEQMLQERGKTAQELIEELQVKSAPLVAVQEVRHIPAERWLTILGSENGETGLFRTADQKTGLTIVKTGDKHRIACLSSVHGLNPLQLKQSNAWREAYAKARADGRLLHVIPEFDPQAEAALVNDDKLPDETTNHPTNGAGSVRSEPLSEGVDDVSV